MSVFPAVTLDSCVEEFTDTFDSTRFSFASALTRSGIGEPRRVQIRDIQVNVGKLCNQACNHCHVDAGPKRTEVMEWATMEKIVQWCARHDIKTVDITGGAPELNPNFRKFAESCLEIGANVISRCNLTVLLEPGQESLAEWYADHKIALICSLPCYSKENLEAQRGKGVFRNSIRALQMLNNLNYGRDPELSLDLVYNPIGGTLPPAQSDLEAAYKTRLSEDFGICFNNLFTITNLPISRFRHYLERSGDYENYMNLLVEHFNPDTVEGLMCRHIISVDWLGRIFDCDFNQMMDIHAGWRSPRYLWNLTAAEIETDRIAFDSHCFGCTAGAGSSCTGTLT
ncbi:MAG: arsenosugar biosynthesis radical SAM protein ArsS [Acidiferrobacterales bacterium]|nr:arsenosugar biosynthesis radical SAM protein ArsS [Acidiferrobacterales bacterium]